MQIDLLVEGAEIARRCLPSSVRDADVVAVTAEIAWQESGVRIIQLDYQFMKRQRSWTGREGRVWAGFVEIERRSGNARLGSHGEYGLEQAKAMAARMGHFPPPALALHDLALDLGPMETLLETVLTAEPKVHTLALGHEEGQPLWSLVAEKQDGEVVTLHWNAKTGDGSYSKTDIPQDRPRG